MEHDMQFWKIGKGYIKNFEEVDLIEGIIKENYETLKLIHLYYACRSSYPYL